MSQEPEVKAAVISDRSGIWIAIIGLVGGVLIAVLTPFAVKWANRPEPVQEAVSLAIEQIPQQVFSYADTSSGGWSALWLISEHVDAKTYRFDYWLPEGKSGYAGLAFQFLEGSNLAGYSAVECTVTFSQSPDTIDLYFKDIADNFNTIRVTGNNTNEMNLRYVFTNFPGINFNAVKEFGVVVNADFSTGGHQVFIENVRFVK